jgi:hypothetical protein
MIRVVGNPNQNRARRVIEAMGEPVVFAIATMSQNHVPMFEVLSYVENLNVGSAIEIATGYEIPWEIVVIQHWLIGSTIANERDLEDNTIKMQTYGRCIELVNDEFTRHILQQELGRFTRRVKLVTGGFRNALHEDNEEVANVPENNNDNEEVAEDNDEVAEDNDEVAEDNDGVGENG